MTEVANFNKCISVDCTVIRYYNNELQVLLVDREITIKDFGELQLNHHALTSNLIDESETIEQMVNRNLLDLNCFEKYYFEQHRAITYINKAEIENDRSWFFHFDRDPDKQIISIGFFALVVSRNIEFENENLKWVPIPEVGALAFFHNQLLNETLISLKNKINCEPIVFHLLPDKFSLSDLQQVYELILGTNLDKRNFRKKVSRLKYLIPLDEKQKGVRHKPAQLYVFDRNTYDKTLKAHFKFQ